jgi:hypothetical protein
MSPFYQDQERFHVAADCIILGFREGKIYLLVAKRRFDPLKGRDTLMGGFLRGDEHLSQTISRVLYEYTGIRDVYMEQVGVYGDIDRDSGRRVVSIACYALIDMMMFDESLCEKHDARWVELDKVGELVLDHNRMLEDTLTILRRKAASQPVGFNLLPEKFTIPQLQSLYEAIFDRTFDKRNFRKKLREMDILEIQADKDKSGSKKGAFYYKFNSEKYERLLREGFSFSM